MKLIHCADLHLDSGMTTNLTAEQARERRIEILRTFSHMVEYADKNGVSGIMISGDMFDTRSVSNTTRGIVKDEIANHPGIHFFYLRGNHDDDSFLAKLDVIPPNLHLYGEHWTTYNLGAVTISGLELSERTRESMYESLRLERGKYNIVMLHGQISAYAAGKNAESINLDAFKNKNIDYLALGHVHRRQTGQLDVRGMYAYPGCLEGRGFDECGEKGFLLLDINEESCTATYRFVPIAARTLYEIAVDVTGVESTNAAAQRIESAIAENQYPAKSLVRVVLTGCLDVECEINIDYLEELFSEYFYFLTVSDKTSLLIRFEDYEKDESLKGEFVRLVKDSAMAEGERAEIIRCGILALSGEEI